MMAQRYTTNKATVCVTVAKTLHTTCFALQNCILYHYCPAQVGTVYPTGYTGHIVPPVPD